MATKPVRGGKKSAHLNKAKALPKTKTLKDTTPLLQLEGIKGESVDTPRKNW
jgi:hypothetical protein